MGSFQGPDLLARSAELSVAALCPQSGATWGWRASGSGSEPDEPWCLSLATTIYILSCHSAFRQEDIIALTKPQYNTSGQISSRCPASETCIAPHPKELFYDWKRFLNCKLFPWAKSGCGVSEFGTQDCCVLCFRAYAVVAVPSASSASFDACRSNVAGFLCVWVSRVRVVALRRLGGGGFSDSGPRIFAVWNKEFMPRRNGSGSSALNLCRFLHTATWRPRSFRKTEDLANWLPANAV